ncbi:MAG: CoA transferase [Chloroflexi bacterium]|nr:CoA transferase [Chloroflexota bacterium]
MQALDGLRVIEMGSHLPGEYCTMLLADLGAEVIRIDNPNPRRPEGGREAFYALINRNKRSMGLDLKHSEAQEILHRLIPSIDVMVECNRPGVNRRLGADYETLSAINPRLIYCAITGYGQEGPYRMLPGHDVNYIALGGVLDLTGAAGSAPAIPGVNVADLGGGTMYAILGILTAIIARDRTGRGQKVDVAMLDGVVAWLEAVHGAGYFSRGEAPGRGQWRLSGVYPFYGPYECADGKYISLGVLEPWFWNNLCRVLGREDLVPLMDAEGPEREAVKDALRQAFRTRPRDEWFAILREADVEAAPVNSMAEAFEDPQVRVRGMATEVEHPVLGRLRQPGLPVKLSGTPGAIRRPAPRSGQDTEEILAGLGYDAGRIAALREAHIIR